MCEGGVLTVAGCPGCRRLQNHALTAWDRGHRMGRMESERLVVEARRSLCLEQEAHAATNAALTEALMAAEAEVQRLRAALRRLGDDPGASLAK